MAIIPRGIFINKNESPVKQLTVGITITGAGGAGGGNGVKSGSAGFGGQTITGSFLYRITDQLDISIGTGGKFGASQAISNGGGQGGTNTTFAGGSGGNAGTVNPAGAGGGGGAATTVKLNKVLIAVAGGGGGGAGGGKNSEGQPPEPFDPASVPQTRSTGTNGQSKAGPGGGAGGGGGGFPGGNGGLTVPGDEGGYSGATGGNFIDKTGLSTGANANNGGDVGANGSNGKVVITYSVSGATVPLFLGGIVTVNGSTFTHTFTLSDTFKVDPQFLKYSWKEVQRPYYKLGPTWIDIKRVYTKSEGAWRLVYPASGSLIFRSPGTYTFRVPPGNDTMTATLLGGGGGGGSGTEIIGAGGGGGGSGGFIKNEQVAVTGGQIITIKVGAGGAGSGVPGRAATADGRPGGASSVTGDGISLVATGGGGGGGGIDSGGGGGGCCVVSTAFAERKIWTQQEKFDLMAWCEKYLHGNWWGETFRRGYQVLGSKIVIPYLLRKDGKLLTRYAAWAFTNGCNLVRGRKFTLASLPNSLIWIAGFIIVGACVSKTYADKCWKSLY